MSYRQSETILVIDDNSAVLSITDAMLARHGYRAIASLNGKQAIELLENWTDLEIDVALIDVVLGDTAGPDVAKEILRLRPGLPIVFMTGYPEHREFLAAQGQFVLKKPFTSLVLVQTIRQALDRGRKAAPTTSAPSSGSASV